MRISFSLNAVGFSSGKRRPWIAEIRGRHERFGYVRKFLRPAIEYGRKDRPERLWYSIREGDLCEVQEHVKGSKLRRYFAIVRRDGLSEIPSQQVSAEIESRDEKLKRPLGTDVYSAARERVAWIFDNFPRVVVSFSGGKDSTVLLHLAADEARKRRRRIGVLFIDWEAQYDMTIRHVGRCLDDYADCVDPHWVALPLTTVNACSQIEPEWTCWAPDRRKAWVREPPARAITDPRFFPFYRHAMTFEEFVPHFGNWYAQGQLTCCLVGLRAQESLNRFRALVMRGKTKFAGRAWTTWLGGPAWNAYPIYDWRTEDIWTYTAREKKSYNSVYDRMHAAGLTPHQMRVCEPYGDEQRRGLWLYHILEPETWPKVVARVAGAGTGAIYCAERGSVMGNAQIAKPDGHTWRSFTELLLTTMPPPTAAHYRAKIAVWTNWWVKHLDGRGPIAPYDESPGDLSGRDQFTWRRVCKVLLKNDYWCKGLGFSPNVNVNAGRYQESVRKKIAKWSGSKKEEANAQT